MAELARRDNDSRLTRPTARVAGRERVASQRLLPNGDTPDLIEIMCPLIDAALLPAWRAAITPMETRNDFAAEQALNGLANAFAQAAGRWPPPRPLQPSDDLRPVSFRPAGLVFDYVPLIHRDTRLVGWGAAAHRRVNGTRCPRLLTAADGGRRARWRVWAQEATANATARLAERPWRWTYV
mmetsp:Transcript_23638/g.69285  ORF Transcript_23638/g.69285 Transcript_23638/m.69285 type:complete len:182 (-) Transcript_23638:31-576(-)